MSIICETRRRLPAPTGLDDQFSSGNWPEDTPDLLDFQARRLAVQFAMSPRHARLTAQLALDPGVMR